MEESIISDVKKNAMEAAFSQKDKGDISAVAASILSGFALLFLITIVSMCCFLRKRQCVNSQVQTVDTALELHEYHEIGSLSYYYVTDDNRTNDRSFQGTQTSPLKPSDVQTDSNGYLIPYEDHESQQSRKKSCTTTKLQNRFFVENTAQKFIDATDITPVPVGFHNDNAGKDCSYSQTSEDSPADSASSDIDSESENSRGEDYVNHYQAIIREKTTDDQNLYF